MYGQNDEFVPKRVDKAQLVARWEEFVREGGGIVDEMSGILENARHAIKDEEALANFVSRVDGFLSRVGNA